MLTTVIDNESYSSGDLVVFNETIRRAKTTHVHNNILHVFNALRLDFAHLDLTAKELLQEMEQPIAKSVYKCTATDLIQFLAVDRTGPSVRS